MWVCLVLKSCRTKEKLGFEHGGGDGVCDISKEKEIEII